MIPVLRALSNQECALTRLRANDVDEGLFQLPGLMLRMRDGKEIRKDRQREKT
jgi:hypothetical protein